MCVTLFDLTELELIDRERRMVERRIRMAKFPAVKSLDSFDFKAMPSLNKMMVLELARCEYIERRENVIALGNSGTGKTHIALGLGLVKFGQKQCKRCRAPPLFLDGSISPSASVWRLVRKASPSALSRRRLW